MNDMKSIFATRPCLSLPEVETYLNNQCSGQQLQEVENHLLDCPLCSAAVEGLAQEERLDELPQVLAALKPPLPKSSHRVKPQRMAWINRAAAVALLLIIAYAGYHYWGAISQERLFAQNFHPMENPYPVLRSGDPKIADNPELQMALGFYLKGDFAASLPHLENYLADHSPDSQASLLAANVYLQTGRAQQAVQLLLQLQKEDPQLQGFAKWYLALAYLKLGQTESARQLLYSITLDEYSPFQARAAVLSEKL
jgi:hypothetical protein